MKNFARWVIARGREPSTYAGLAILLGMFAVPNADSWAKDIAQLAVGAFSVLAMAMSETGLLD